LVNDFKKNFKRALGGIKTGVDNMSRAAYFLPEKIDKVMTKLTSKMTDSIYDASDKKPATSNSKQVDAMEAKLRQEFDVEEVLTRAEDIFQKIIDKLNIANNTESATTKNLLKMIYLFYIKIIPEQYIQKQHKIDH
jgi:glutamyl-tRNA reductase